MLILRGVHIAAELVGSLPELLLETQIGPVGLFNGIDA
jgi:hypothetical protein